MSTLIDLVGLTIKSFRPATPEELEMLGLDELGMFEQLDVLELSDGSVLVPMQDEEGNGPGAWNRIADGEAFVIFNDAEGEAKDA